MSGLRFAFAVLLAVAATPATAITIDFEVTFDTQESTGVFATGSDGSFVPVAFYYQVEVDLENLAFFGPEELFPGQISGTSFPIVGGGSSPLTSAVYSAFAAVGPSLSSTLQSPVVGTQGTVQGFDADVLGVPLLNETLGLGLQSAQVIDDPAFPIVFGGYSLSFRRDTTYEESGQLADRSPDMDDLLADYFFVGSTFDVVEQVSIEGYDELGFLVVDGFFRYTGTATIISIPEPGSALLIGSALLALTGRRRLAA